jgi:hypothetical protein
MLLTVPCEPRFKFLNLARGRDVLRLGNHPEHVNQWSHSTFSAFVAARAKIERAWTVFQTGRRAMGDKLESLRLSVFGIPSHRPSPVVLFSLGAGLICSAFIALVAAFPLGVAGDYPNHLARAWIESEIANSPALQRYYELDWRAIPDLTMDLVVPSLSRLIGVYPAGAAMIALAALVGPLAGLWLAKRLHGRIGLLPLFGFAAIFSLNLEFGLVNFLVASGLAVAAFALWIGMAPSLRRSLVFAPIGLLLVVNHGLGFLLFGFIALLWEIASYARAERGRLPNFIRQLTVYDGLAVAPGLLYLALALAGSGDGALRPVDASTDFWGSRSVALLAPFRFFCDPMSVATAILAATAVYGGAALGLWRGALRIEPRMAAVCGGLFVLMLLIPEHLLGVWGLHFRYGPAFVILLAASLRFAPQAARARAAALGLLAGVVAAQFVNGYAHMRRTDDYLSGLRAGLSALPDGACVLQAYDPGAENRLANHAGALAVIEADAYVATLFTNTSPVSVRPGMRARHLPAGEKITADDLAAAADQPLTDSENGLWSNAYYSDWPRQFTHLLYARASGAPVRLDEACPVSVTQDFILFRTDPARMGCGRAGRKFPEEGEDGRVAGP